MFVRCWSYLSRFWHWPQFKVCPCSQLHTKNTLLLPYFFPRLQLLSRNAVCISFSFSFFFYVNTFWQFLCAFVKVVAWFEIPCLYFFPLNVCAARSIADTENQWKTKNVVENKLRNNTPEFERKENTENRNPSYNASLYFLWYKSSIRRLNVIRHH